MLNVDILKKMIPALLFLSEILVLFFLSRTITKSISKTLYKIVKNKNLAIGIYSLIFLPGTILHEIAHFLTATTLLVRTGKIEIFPRVQDNEIRLGSVAIEKTDPVRRLVIGIAPVIFGIGIIFFSISFFASNINLPIQPNTFNPAFILILLYILFAVGNTMFSSKKDMEGALEILALLAIISLVFYLFGIRVSFQLANGLLSQEAALFLQKLDIFMAIMVAFDFFLLLFFLLFKKVF